MLVLNNGVPKSGSTWMQGILVNLLSPGFPSEAWANGNVNPGVAKERLKDYFLSGEWKGAEYTLLKTHVPYEPQYDFADDSDVRVVVTYRRLTDSVLSWFHHQVRLGNVEPEGQAAWLEDEGRKFTLRAINHRLSWEGHENALMINYEAMVADAIPGIFSVMQFLGMPSDEGQARDLIEKTQVRVSDKSKLREGMHVRTGGLSVAKDELPEDYYAQLVTLQAIVDDGMFDEEVGKAFLSGALG